MASAERAHRVRMERIRDLYGARRSYVFAVVAGALVAIQAAAWAWPAGDRRGALEWLVIALAAEAAVGLLTRAFHARERRDDELQAWATARIVGEGLRGVAWALMAFLTLDAAAPLSLLPICVTLTGLVAGSTAGLAVHVPSMTAFVAGSMPVAAVFLLLRDPDGDGLLAAGMLGTGVIMILLNSVRMSAIYSQLIESRLDLSDQLDQRRALQEAAEEGRRLAEDAAVERTRFFGAASHDLRQPVHALGLYASLLRRDPPAKERRELIAAVASCVEALDRLFNAILGAAQAVATRDDRRAAALPLHDVISRTVLQFIPEAERRGLALRVRPTTAWVWADPTPLERVLANLLSNALRYTERGAVLVAVRRRGTCWELVVADTGIGLDAGDQGRVFDAFFRVEQRRSDDNRAFGLGLATVRQICLTHGWDISLSSRPGKGSIFAIRLPATPAGSPPGPRADESADAEALAHRVRVLVVEDDPLVGDAVTKLLASWDADVHLCDGSTGALEILERHPGGRWIGILDYRLAGPETGLDVADSIRARLGDDIPLVLLTGELDTEVFDAAGARGLTVLQKPLRPIRLRALLASAAARKAAA
ncbi:MAG: hybrid sensor histidine kinase/response regulator [Pseudomonadota bacterium]